jgi:Carboxypeptidase regulatory-like domain/TonB dependent receptor
MRRSIALAVALAFLATGIPAIAGTTGGMSGTVTETGSMVPIAGAKVTANSPSQLAIAISDASGHFAFVSLAPDEYTVSVEKTGYESATYPGVTVFADAQQTLSLAMHKSLTTIASVKSRASSDLVRAGTTADLYSVNAAQQERVSALGGGGALNSAYSAIASVPGAYVPSNQSGYLQAVHVRGGDSYEVGYEFDGIPVNRAFDNYPSGSLSSLGQLELQVYTGATPSNAEAQGLAGFVNQVIKTGTFPGYATANAGVGAPASYHNLQVEAGGATPDRLFSYYIGVGGFNQDHRYIDQFDGASYVNEFGNQLGSCPSPNKSGQLPAGTSGSCYTNGAPNVGPNGSTGWLLGPVAFGTLNPASIASRTTVMNVHIGIPHKKDGLRDDIQILYNNDAIFTSLYSSVNDEGIQNYKQTVSKPGYAPYPPTYLDSYQYNGPIGAFLPANYESMVTPYLYPSSPAHTPFVTQLPDYLNNRDVEYNNQGIFKLQYQKNFSSSAYLRIYGYSYYSDWLENGEQLSNQPYAYYDGGDYEINNHTRGVSIAFTDQISPTNLIEAEGSYTTSTGARIYNSQMFGSSDAFAVLVNPNSLGSGTCYAAPSGGKGKATPTSCSDQEGSVNYGSQIATFASLSGVYNGSPPPAASGMTCGGGPCAYYALESGANGELNSLVPDFYGLSLTDQWHPSDRLNFNFGIRLDSYTYNGSDTDTGPARAFWFNAFNQDTCFDTKTLALYDRTALLGSGQAWTTNAQAPCSSFGSQYVNANMQNISGQQYVYNIWQPRVGMTYTVNTDTVLRASYGKYNEQPSSAYEQYNSLQQNLADELSQFYAIGFTTPGHGVQPSVSYNSDFSIEHHIKGTDMSFKLSPFLRQTQDQVENFYINYTQGLTSGLNAGNQTSKGFEFEFNKGDFNRNGIAAQLSFAYTYATVKYNTLQNGTTIISPINAGISQYNAYTKACAPGGAQVGKTQFGVPVCGGTSNGQPAAPCYTSSGIADPTCAPKSVANPYWDSPSFGLDDPTASYIPYSTFPGPVGSGVNAYNFPYVATLILNYKHNRFAITPSFQFQAGNRYGAPLTLPGVDPALGCKGLAGRSTAGDPRYPYGASGGLPFDATNCGTDTLAIPDPYTGQFDGIGAFREPAQLVAHLRIAYDISPRVSLTLTLANLLQTCFGGQTTGFTYYTGSNVCTYGNLVGGPNSPPVGNAYNPGANVQTFLKYPYEPYFGTYNDLSSSLGQPFTAFLSLKVKL